MTQYNSLALPAGAAAAGAGYYGAQSSQGHSRGGHSRSPSGGSGFMTSMAAAGAGAYGATQFSRQQSSAPSYYTGGSNQAYTDQYGIAQNYADRNNGPFSDHPNDRYSGEGSRESGHARRESE